MLRLVVIKANYLHTKFIGHCTFYLGYVEYLNFLLFYHKSQLSIRDPLLSTEALNRVYCHKPVALAT